MDNTKVFSEPDLECCASDLVNLEALQDHPHDRPQLFEFGSIVDDDKGHLGVARKGVTRFFFFSEILRNKHLLQQQGVQFNNWFIDKKVPKNDKRRTHVALNFASFSIPPNEEAEFLERQAIGLASGRSFWMIERPTQVCRLFFDMDFKNLGPLTGPGIEAAALVAGRAASKFFPDRDVNDSTKNLRMVVCCTDIKKDTIETSTGRVNVHKTGVHLHWPNVFVTGQQAMTIRETVLADLIATFGNRVGPQQNAWDDVVDSSVFYKDGKEGSGLRMQGSRKAEDCPVCKHKKSADGSRCRAPGCCGGKVDAGRPQALLFATDGSLRRNYDQEDMYRKNLHSLVIDTSIRSHLNLDEVASGSEGFVLPPGAPLQVGKSTKTEKVFRGDSVGATSTGTTRTVVPGSQQDILQQIIHESQGDKQSSVVVSSVKQVTRDKTFLVNVTGLNSHQCQNIGREHKSNRIYFMISMEGIVQRCQDPSDALSDEMRFGLCKNQASTVVPLAKRHREHLWPKMVDDATSVTSFLPDNSREKNFRIKPLLIMGDFLSGKLQGSSWSSTLSFDNQKFLRDRSEQKSVAPDDIGIKARQAMIELGFLAKEPEDVPQRKVRFEVPLSQLEEEVWDSFHDWVDMVSSMSEIRLMAHVSKGPQDTKVLKRRKIEL